MSLQMAKRETSPPFPIRKMAISERRRRLIARQAELEKYWRSPPSPSGLQKHRTNLKKQFIRPLIKEGMHVVDLGCGEGTLLKHLASDAWHITSVDGSSNALNLLKKHHLSNVSTVTQMLPVSSFPDKSFDLVLCCDLIAELEPEEHRLMISELVRLVTDKGKIVITTPLNTQTDHAAERLLHLVSTEMTVDTVGCSYSGIQSRYFPNTSRFYPWVEKLGSLSPERNRDFLLIEAHKKPLTFC